MTADDLPKQNTARREAWFHAAVHSAVVAALFSLVVCALLAWNYVHMRRVDPYTSPRLTQLKAELQQRPQDAQLKQTIRNVDQQLRTEYFRRRQFTDQGVWLLLGGIAVFLLSAAGAHALRPVIPMPSKESEAAGVLRHRVLVQRRAVAIAGVVLGAGLVALVVISPRNLTAGLTRALQTAIGKEKVAVTNVPGNTDQPVTATPGDPAGNSAVNTAAGNSATTTTIFPPGQKPVVNAAAEYPTAAEIAKNWPGFRGPGARGVAPAGAFPTEWDGAKGKNVRWKSPIPLPGHNTPVIWNDRLFLTGANEKERKVFCYDLNGKLLWQTAVPKKGTGEVTVMDDTGYAAPTLATDGKRVFAMFPNGDVAGVDVAGKLLWTVNLGAPDSMYGHAASPVMYKNRVIVQYDRGSAAEDGKSSLCALDNVTGKTVWETPRPVPNSWSTPLVIDSGNSGVVVACGSPWVIGYNADTGKELWRAEGLSGDVAPSPIYAGGMIIACNTGSSLLAIKPGGSGNVTKSNVAWKAEDGLPDVVSPASDGELVFLVSSGIMTCYDIKTGAKVWEHEIDGYFYSSPIIAGKSLYMTDTSGVTQIIAVGREFKSLGKTELGDEVYASPVFHNGRIYFRGKQQLYCIGTGK